MDLIFDEKCSESDNKSVSSTQTNDNPNSCQSMSKKQLKRLLRNKKWLESRPEKRRQEKEKKKLKLKRLREEGVEVIRKRCFTPMSSSECKVKVCIDCHFEDYMNENEMKKLVKQIGRCYSVNRHSETPVQLYITSITSKIRQIFNRSQPGFTNWDAVCTETHFIQLFTDKTKLIYLSSDSSDVIPEPKDIRGSNDYIFIIGGLVDHNRHKGLCHRLAVEQSLRTGRLPIDEYIEMTQRRVLAVNHVFEIMLKASNGSSDDWNNIFKEVIPLRKLKPN